MTDIAKCAGTNCPKKETCYRYTAPVNELWQSYSNFWEHKSEECYAYWDIAEEIRK